MRYDNNLVVVGAGSAGLIAALIAATVKARVTLIEGGAMGGDCLNTGCVPSKTLIASAKAAHAGEMIGEFVTAMRAGLGLKKILGTIHVYPTYLEANKLAAGAWRRRHAPEKLLDWVGKVHGAMRALP